LHHDQIGVLQTGACGGKHGVRLPPMMGLMVEHVHDGEPARPRHDGFADGGGGPPGEPSCERRRSRSSAQAMIRSSQAARSRFSASQSLT